MPYTYLIRCHIRFVSVDGTLGIFGGGLHRNVDGTYHCTLSYMDDPGDYEFQPVRPIVARVPFLSESTADVRLQVQDKTGEPYEVRVELAYRQDTRHIVTLSRLVEGKVVILRSGRGVKDSILRLTP